MRSFGDLVARRDALEAARAQLARMAGALDDDLARADAAHGALQQPAEVKARFDKAYERLVSIPAATLRDVAPVADRTFADALDLAAFLKEHKSEVVVSGSILQASSAPLRDALNVKLQKLRGGRGGRATRAKRVAEGDLRFGRLTHRERTRRIASYRHPCSVLALFSSTNGPSLFVA